MRTTKTHLHTQIGHINNLLKSNNKQYTYALDCAYGGYRLVYQDEHGGVINVSTRMTCRELYNTLQTLEKVLIITFIGIE